MARTRRDRAPETDCASLPPGPGDGWNPYRVVCPGIYAGRIDARVKIGYSLNLPQRVDAFRFDELIAIWPVSVLRDSSEDDRA
jgi:hypothetical protein